MEDDSVVELTEEADHSYSFVMPAGAVSVSAEFEKNDAGTDNPDQPSKPDQPQIPTSHRNLTSHRNRISHQILTSHRNRISHQHL